MPRSRNYGWRSKGVDVPTTMSLLGTAAAGYASAGSRRSLGGEEALNAGANNMRAYLATRVGKTRTTKLNACWAEPFAAPEPEMA